MTWLGWVIVAAMVSISVFALWIGRLYDGPWVDYQKAEDKQQRKHGNLRS